MQAKDRVTVQANKITHVVFYPVPAVDLYENWQALLYTSALITFCCMEQSF